MRFQGMEIENGDTLKPGHRYYLVETDARIIHKRDGTKQAQPRVTAVKRKQNASVRVRVFCDRTGRRCVEEVS